MVKTGSGSLGVRDYGFGAGAGPWVLGVLLLGVAGCSGPDCGDAGVLAEDRNGRRVTCNEPTATETGASTSGSSSGTAATTMMSMTEMSSGSTETGTGTGTDSTMTGTTTGGGWCGDGVVDAGEECDEGEGKNDDAGECTTACKRNVCGDGKVFVEKEECDDGNTRGGDGCSRGCAVEQLRVFVTSEEFNGNLGGLVGADDKCTVLAQKARLPGVYMAWLSDGELSPASRFGLEEYKGRFVLVDGAVIAEGWTALVDGALGAAIGVDENNNAVMGVVVVWTGTATSGGGALEHCDGWLADAAESSGLKGNAVEKGESWTWEPPAQSCNNTARLYCFQVQ